MAALVALHDEIHEAFGDVALPEEVEHLRERLRNFEGIPSIEPPTIVADILRDYQRRGLDFLDYLCARSNSAAFSQTKWGSGRRFR